MGEAVAMDSGQVERVTAEPSQGAQAASTGPRIAMTVPRGLVLGPLGEASAASRRVAVRAPRARAWRVGGPARTTVSESMGNFRSSGRCAQNTKPGSWTPLSLADP